MSVISQILQVLSNKLPQKPYELDIIIPFLHIRKARVGQIKFPQRNYMLQ